jgi:hypothetical protein
MTNFEKWSKEATRGVRRAIQQVSRQDAWARDAERVSVCVRERRESAPHVCVKCSARARLAQNTVGWHKTKSFAQVLGSQKDRALRYRVGGTGDKEKRTGPGGAVAEAVPVAAVTAARSGGAADSAATRAVAALTDGTNKEVEAELQRAKVERDKEAAMQRRMSVMTRKEALADKPAYFAPMSLTARAAGEADGDVEGDAETKADG